MSTHASVWIKNHRRLTQLEQCSERYHSGATWRCYISVFVCFCAACCSPNPEHLCRGRDVEGGLMAGHMGRASSPSVCQPTWLLLWQACPRQDHRLGPPVGLQQGSPASPSPLEHPSFHLRPGGPHPALQPSAPRCHRSLSCSALRWNNSIVFHCLPCCACNRSSLGACFFIFIYFSACGLPCPQAARFQIRLLRGSSFEWCVSIFREQIPERPFYSYCTNVVRLSKLPLVSAVLLNGPTWRTDETLDPDSQGFIAKTIAGSIFCCIFLSLVLTSLI